ncbi:TetR family transcriptional regulator [Necropsobacter rosorum]|uniref:TetR/AcrR family transcriptional regulator n=1 Tax=Necropsobacter rosorum TaxID=908285 RepID=UPI000A03C241
MKKTLNFVVKESITEALLRLMGKKDFDHISISEITKLAGVSRISFYRNFDSKEDILLKTMFERSMSAFDSQKTESIQDKLIAMFVSINSIHEIIDLLYAQNLTHLFLRYFQWAIGPKAQDDNPTAYRKSIAAGVCFGALDEWIRRGRQETPAQMAQLLQNVMRMFFDEQYQSMAMSESPAAGDGQDTA